MLNWIWFLLMAVGVMYSAVQGTIDAVTEAAFSAASDTVMLILEICGLLCLWLGIFRIAERSGLVEKLGRMITPLISLLFPGVSKSSPAFAAIVMNVAANFLGLGNAATPFGLKAMEHLQAENRRKDTASDAMITLLAMNTSCITVLPTLMISLRASMGSAEPASIIGATLLSSVAGLVFALLLDRLLQNRKGGRLG